MCMAVVFGHSFITYIFNIVLTTAAVRTYNVEQWCRKHIKIGGGGMNGVHCAALANAHKRKQNSA